MAYNSRYYQYETSPRKLEPEYERPKRTYPKKSTAKTQRTTRKEQAKKVKKMQRKAILYIAICFISLFVISYRYSVIDNTYAKLKDKKTELATIEKETTQLEASIESSINLTKIEQDAKDILGMQKLSPEQKIYVTLPKTDHIESSSEEIKSSDLKPNWIMEIINKIVESFK
ncbi:MAG: hypothetical protein HFJ52_00065 [Clostridia bacterium]|nr:hypothetical protein [Clostridia bacterium]